MSVYNRYAFDRSLIPFLYGRRYHCNSDVQRQCLGYDGAKTIVSVYDYNVPFAESCKCRPRAQFPVDLQQYASGRPVTQIPDQTYQDLWRCRMYRYLQRQSDVIPFDTVCGSTPCTVQHEAKR